MGAELGGKVAIVTGAASGIGRATAQALVAAGAKVALFDRVDTAETAEGFESGNTAAFRVDVTDEASVIAGVAAVEERFGGIDILAHLAGIFEYAPLLETSLEDFNRILNINVSGTFLIVRETVRAMRRLGRGGRIITTSSELAQLGREGHAAYCASKSAAAAMARCWAREFGPDILVNAIAPGPVDTPLLGWKATPDDLKASELAGNPLGRIGQPQEIAAVIRFLVGPGGSYITGQTIGANGGAAM
ncbi:MAG: SDR family oxidoreductase [Parvibaculaceae bacterium]|nr:SDR family oxidoreductase [Parvibaculaceae bacterium]